jgi:hypothetical protein
MAKPEKKTHKKLQAIEKAAGILNDLSPKELKAFKAASKRRPFSEGVKT